MWWTPNGERILEGSEARLFREALGVVSDLIYDDEGGFQFGITAFDTLQRGQKLAVLAEIGGALLRQGVTMLNLTAVREAAVAVVYRQMLEMVQLELDDPELPTGSPSWRQMVLDACQETGMEALPDAGCEDPGEWQLLIDCLADAVLWDEDWDDADLHLDAEPQVSRALKEELGIDENYFVDVPIDPPEQAIEQLHRTIYVLTQGLTPHDDRVDESDHQ